MGEQRKLMEGPDRNISATLEPPVADWDTISTSRDKFLDDVSINHVRIITNAAWI